MIETFLSIVIEINRHHSGDEIVDFLKSFGSELAERIEDYELILVDNGARVELETLSIEPSLRRNCYVLKLARPVAGDNARFAGLEQANGDFALCADLVLSDHINLLEEMTERGRDGADMVYLRNKRSLFSGPSFRRRLFFAAMRLSGERQYHPRDRREFLLSRRALNWVVRDQTEGVFLTETITSLGFETAVMEVNLSARPARRSMSEALSEAWSTLSRSPRFLSGIAQTVIVVFFAVFLLTSLDATLVRLFERNIFGQPDTIVPGWTFLVLIISLGFTLFSVLLYVILRLNLLILATIKRRPRYIIEQFQRI